MKNKILKLGLVLLGTALISGAISCSKSTKKKIVIKGSTTVLPITQKAAEVYQQRNKNVSITIEGSGSGNGIRALLEGNCDIANASRAMKDKEKIKAQQKGIRYREITVALDMIIPVVHPANKVSNLSLDQLKAIYEGSITNWKQIGGDNENIVVVSRDTSSGTYEVWHKLVMKKKNVKKDSLLQASNGAVLTTVAKNKKAIGYIGYGYVNNSIKTLQVNGVEGTISNGKSKRYPISRDLYMYVNVDKIDTKVQGFLDFILGPQGQRLVKETGFIPL